MRLQLAILFCFLYFSVTAEDAPEFGLASVYSAKFQGKVTASLEPFSHQTMSASHRRLPFGTLIKVTRMDNGRSIIVRVNDRGPFVNDFVTNLSLAAAQKLGMNSDDEVRVKVEELNAANNEPPVSVMPDKRSNRPSATRRQNESPLPKQESAPEVTPKSIVPKEYKIVPNSGGNQRMSSSSSGGASQKKSLK
jgi:rare lipoprotein A